MHIHSLTFISCELGVMKVSRKSTLCDVTPSVPFQSTCEKCEKTPENEQPDEDIASLYSGCILFDIIEGLFRDLWKRSVSKEMKCEFVSHLQDESPFCHIWSLIHPYCCYITITCRLIDKRTHPPQRPRCAPEYHCVRCGTGQETFIKQRQEATGSVATAVTQDPWKLGTS